MIFLSLVAALLLEHWRPLRSGHPLYVGYSRYVNAIARNFDAGQYRDGIFSWLFAVVPFALLALSVHLLVSGASNVLTWLWNVAVLYLALGFGRFSHFYNEVMGALRSGDLTRARDVLGGWRGKPAHELTAGEVARVAIELGLERAHTHVFGVIAWFVVAGPVGAVLYRLAAILSDRTAVGAEDRSAFSVFASQAFEVIDWLPVRLTAVGFAVAGDFMGAVECWREQASAWRPRRQGILLAAAAGALGVKLGGVLHQEGGIEYRTAFGDGDDADAEYMRAAVGLIWRALVLWMFLIALATIASWF